ELRDAAVPDDIEISVALLHLARFEALEKLMHRPQHVGMRVEGSARKGNVGGSIVAVTFHQLATAAEHAGRQTTPQRLAVSHHVGLNAEVFLGAAVGETKAGEDFVEDEDDVSVAADVTDA